MRRRLEKWQNGIKMDTSDKQEQKGNKAIELGEIAIVEDFVPEDEEWEKVFDYPYQTLVHEVVGVFKDCTVTCSISVDQESQDIFLTSGVSEPVEIEVLDKKITVALTVEDIGEDAFISYIALYFISLGPVPVRVSDVVVRQHPEHGKTMMFDVGESIELASGCETSIHKEAQIRNPDGTIFNIKQSTANFIWRGNKLYCDLPTGHTYAFRVKYKTEEREIEWSDWLSVPLKRARIGL